MIWDLVWAGLLTNDTLAPLRTVLGAGKSWAPGPRQAGLGAPMAPGPAASGWQLAGQPATGGSLVRGGGRLSARRPGFGRGSLPSHAGPPTVSGRWSLVPPPDPDPTRRLHAKALSLLDRHGIVIRGVAASERVPGGFGALYPVLRAMEETGQCRRGYFVEGLGAAQFALPGAVDRMRAMSDSVLASLPGGMADAATSAADAPWLTAASRTGQVAMPADSWAAPGAGPPARPARTEAAVVVLAAADPASAYGAALPWPPRPDETPGGHRPGRKAGALVILVAGPARAVRRTRRQDAAVVDVRPGSARPGDGRPRRCCPGRGARQADRGTCRRRRRLRLAAGPGTRGGRLPANAPRPAAARLARRPHGALRDGRLSG